MVENRACESAKIIPETGYFLSEMISDLIDSPPTSPQDTMSNSKLRDCLKAAQSNTEDGKKSKQRLELSSKTKDRSSILNDRDRARKRDRRKPGREKMGGSSKEHSAGVRGGEKTPEQPDKSKKKKDERRYEETTIDNIVIGAFKSWEDLQDEVNERISASRVHVNQCNKIPNSQNEQVSTSQCNSQIQGLPPEVRRVPQVAIDKIEQSTKQHDSAGLNFHFSHQSKSTSSPTQQMHDHKKKRHRERDHNSTSEPSSSFERKPQDALGIATKIDSSQVTEWVTTRDLSGKAASDAKIPADAPRNIAIDQSSGAAQNSHRFVPPFDLARREFDIHFNRARHQQLIGAPPLPHYDHGHPIGNAFHQNPGPIGPQINSSNQYLHHYFGPNPYNQHIRDSNHYGLPPSNQPLFPPHSPFPAPSSLAGPYASPYTITDTIISRQTIIPPPMTAGRFTHLSGALNAIDHSPASMMKYPGHVPSPTERSFIEFARSYANANNISGFMNQSMNSNLNATSSTFNPSFERFLAEQRAITGAHNGLHPGDPTSRFSVPNYYNEARLSINPPSSYYPQLFR